MFALTNSLDAQERANHGSHQLDKYDGNNTIFSNSSSINRNHEVMSTTIDDGTTQTGNQRRSLSFHSKVYSQLAADFDGRKGCEELDEDGHDSYNGKKQRLLSTSGLLLAEEIAFEEEKLFDEMEKNEFIEMERNECFEENNAMEEIGFDDDDVL